ncbi:hypothetical protein MBORA_07140 [Methanobrevibacter oralis]|uniref:Uncharacterized protein n=1 Tax=Methanobrevibacter oralis TaxID=66851 RepID=A0A166BH35_METOA|nr:hypothetical protein [Methanobrevibacter oralis]KZX13343.1 hypothetical protein MBORA_07140 [Methanobrevibacter oralis]
MAVSYFNFNDFIIGFFLIWHLNTFLSSLIKNLKSKNPIEGLNSYIKRLYDKTNRNVIIYYSGWLTSPNNLPNGINDLDKNGFMAMVNGLDFEKGLDLILHALEVVLRLLNL